MRISDWSSDVCSSDLPPLAHVVLDDGIAALEAMLVAQPPVDPFGRVPLFARRRAILLENAIYDTREGIELGAPHRLAAPIARRHGKPQHLGNRHAVQAEYLLRLPYHHPPNVPSQPNTNVNTHQTHPPP